MFFKISEDSEFNVRTQIQPEPQITHFVLIEFDHLSGSDGSTE